MPGRCFDVAVNHAPNSLLDILDLQPLEGNRFRGRSPDVGWQRVFGGQVVGQALVAASRTVSDRQAHSLHAYFLLPGDPKVPIDYHGRTYEEGKKITWRDGFRAIWCIFKYRFFD